MEKISNTVSRFAPGIAICLIVALAAKFLGEHYGAPTMLFALLLGIALNFLTENDTIKAGLDYSAKKILRIGIALLGFRIAFSDLISIGWKPVVLVVAGVITTIFVGMLLARLMGLQKRFGALTGGAVAICGASAAMAISAVMPNSKTHERDTVFAVVGVTTLSTIAMVLYPIISNNLSMSDMEAGIFFGATIHDVAQVVGAGFSVSDSAGDYATMTKLMRVALLVPVVLIIALTFRHKGAEGSSDAPLLPFFLIIFIVIVGVNSFINIPLVFKDWLVEASRLFLIMAIAAVGIKTNLKSMVALGAKPVILMVLQTLWIGILVIVALPYL